MLGDSDRSTRIASTNQTIDYPFNLTLMEMDFNKRNPVSAQLEQVFFAEPGSFTISSNPLNLQVEALITTSQESGLLNTGLAAYLNPIEISQQLKTDPQEHIISLMLKGQFRSVFDSKEKTLTKK